MLSFAHPALSSIVLMSTAAVLALVFAAALTICDPYTVVYISDLNRTVLIHLEMVSLVIFLYGLCSSQVTFHCCEYL